MSSAIKRLSTIIRPGSNPSSPHPKESSKDSIDAPAPAAPVVDNAVATTESASAEPTAPAATNGAADPVAKDAAASAAPEEGAPAVPAPTEETPATNGSVKDKDASVSTEAKKEKAPPSSHRRDPRDIGRSTIKRFSTILRSQGKDLNKEQAPAAQEEATKPAAGEAKPLEGEVVAATDEAKKDDAAQVNGKENADPVIAAKDVPATKPAKTSTPPSATKDPKAPKVGKRRSASFFTAAREGLQRARGQPATAKSPKGAQVQAVAVSKILRKGAAKGKRVVVVTGASKGVGLEFVKQFAKQPDTFVIALSRTADKSVALKPVVAASAKDNHNVRAIKLDVTSTRAINSVIKEIVELTDGRVDLLVNAVGSRGDPALKIWDIKGPELEDELRNNLVGPITFANALIPYLKPFPKPEEKPAAKEEKKEEKAEAKEEKAEAKEEKVEAKEEKAEAKDEKAEAKAEALEAKEAKLDAHTPDLVATTVEPTVEPPAATAGLSEGPAEPAQVEQATMVPTEPTTVEPAAPVEPVPAPTPAPALLPTHPFIVFLSPSDPIHNAGGAVPTGGTFAPAPRTLFSLSRAALQVAIAKYAVGLGSKGVGIVGIERHGHHDPNSKVSDEEAAAAVIKLLPELSVKENGKLLKTRA